MANISVGSQLLSSSVRSPSTGHRTPDDNVAAKLGIAPYKCRWSASGGKTRYRDTQQRRHAAQRLHASCFVLAAKLTSRLLTMLGDVPRGDPVVFTFGGGRFFAALFSDLEKDVLVRCG